MAGISQKRDRSPVPAGQRRAIEKSPLEKPLGGYALEKLLKLWVPSLKGRAENLRLAREGLTPLSTPVLPPPLRR